MHGFSNSRNCVGLRLAVTLVTGLLLAAACSGSHPAPPPPPAQQAVVLVSIDGFRADYLDRYAAPHLRALAARGVRARWLQPVMPTLTFPNHYSIVTGLYPAHHGIVNNDFVDPSDGARFHFTDPLAAAASRWWGGEPLWVTAEKQGVRAATFFWVGSEAEIDGTRPTFYRRYDDAFPAAARVDTVLAWLSGADGPVIRFATLYFSTVDHSGHEVGPDDPEVGAAILTVDSAVGRLVGGIRALGLADRVNVIVVSDHGMSATSADHVVFLDDYLDPQRVEAVSVTPFFAGRARDGDDRGLLQALRRVPHLTVYPRDSTPARWHYDGGNPRISPVLGVVDDGWRLTTHAYVASHPLRAHDGMHGFDNADPAMRATFIAAGPAFRTADLVPPFQNIHIYDLVCAILGLRPAPNDGSLDSVRALLR